MSHPRIRQVAKRLTYGLFYRSGFTNAVWWWNRHQVMILCYHGVTKRSERSPIDPTGLQVGLDRFQHHMEYLIDRANVISLDEYLEKRTQSRPLPPRSVVLTFDDGIRNVLTTAAPYLADKELPASLFVITDRVDARCGSTGSAEWSPADDAASLSWPETEELHRIFGFEIGSHSGSHADLAALSRDEAAHELRRSNDAIKDRLGAERLSLAYPYGRYSAGVMAQARDTGYRCGLTTSGGPNRATTDTFELRRTLIGDGDDEATFAARVAGVTHILTVVATTGRRALAPMARR